MESANLFLALLIILILTVAVIPRSKLREVRRLLSFRSRNGKDEDKE